jgi:hypothetical protein
VPLLDRTAGDANMPTGTAADSGQGSARLVSDGRVPSGGTAGTFASKVNALNGSGCRVRAERALRAGSVPGSAVCTADRASRCRSRRFRTRPAGTHGDACGPWTCIRDGACEPCVCSLGDACEP